VAVGRPAVVAGGVSESRRRERRQARRLFIRVDNGRRIVRWRIVLELIIIEQLWRRIVRRRRRFRIVVTAGKLVVRFRRARTAGSA